MKEIEWPISVTIVQTDDAVKEEMMKDYGFDESDFESGDIDDHFLSEKGYSMEEVEINSWDEIPKGYTIDPENEYYDNYIQDKDLMDDEFFEF